MNRNEVVAKLIAASLAEDLDVAGDVTSQSIFSEPDTTEAIIRAKESGTLSGLTLIEPIFQTIDPKVEVELLCKDGDVVGAMDEICRITGPIIAVLSGERLVLNLLQRLSGVATATAELVNLVGGTSAQLLDTRKTTPGFRLLEKEAVAHGGGTNHRIGLFDMIMAKDTHVKAAGGPDKAVEKAKEWCITHNKELKIEVEVQSLQEFEKALTAGPDRIMLDNMSCEDMAKAVVRRNDVAASVELEASGNVTAKTIRAIAETGVDFISVGAITHSVKALDIHLVLV